MTYCVAVKTKDGLIALADGRITAGTQVSSVRKMMLLGSGKHRFFVATSGLRSVRDKTLAYLAREIETGQEFECMLDVISTYTRCLRRVELEDREALEKAGLSFNYHSIIGGMMQDDRAPHLYLVYPEGNWIEVDHVTPYITIGASGYGKPILDRALRYDTDVKTALKVLYLSFDATKFSSSDVGFPINFLTFNHEEGEWRENSLEDDDVREMRLWWNAHLANLVEHCPEGPWITPLTSGAAL